MYWLFMGKGSRFALWRTFQFWPRHRERGLPLTLALCVKRAGHARLLLSLHAGFECVCTVGCHGASLQLVKSWFFDQCRQDVEVAASWLILLLLLFQMFSWFSNLLLVLTSPDVFTRCTIVIYHHAILISKHMLCACLWVRPGYYIDYFGHHLLELPTGTWRP